MTDVSFVAYVGEADFHDGSLLDLARQGDSLRVRVRGASSKVFVVAFSGVSAVRANSPEGMMLYALAELRSEPALRRFVFVNWEDQSKACLEVEAAGFAVLEE